MNISNATAKLLGLLCILLIEVVIFKKSIVMGPREMLEQKLKAQVPVLTEDPKLIPNTHMVTLTIFNSVMLTFSISTLKDKSFDLT